MNRHPFYSRVALCIVAIFVASSLSTSCTSTSKWHEAQYRAAMHQLKEASDGTGIRRQKIFYHFKLYGIPSTRMGHGGIRGGHTAAWEKWELPGGYELIARKYEYVGQFESRPLTEQERQNLFVPNESQYKEPRLEPIFDTVTLLNPQGTEILRIHTSQSES